MASKWSGITAEPPQKKSQKNDPNEGIQVKTVDLSTVEQEVVRNLPQIFAEAFLNEMYKIKSFADISAAAGICKMGDLCNDLKGFKLYHEFSDIGKDALNHATVKGIDAMRRAVLKEEIDEEGKDKQDE